MVAGRGFDVIGNLGWQECGQGYQLVTCVRPRPKRAAYHRKNLLLLFFVCTDVTFRSPIDRIITPSFARQPDIPKRAVGQLVASNKEGRRVDAIAKELNSRKEYGSIQNRSSIVESGFSALSIRPSRAVQQPVGKMPIRIAQRSGGERAKILERTIRQLKRWKGGSPPKRTKD